MAQKPRSNFRGARAAATRHLLGLSQQEFADLLTLSRDNVKQWEAGKQGASVGVEADIQALVSRHDAEVAALLEESRAGRPAVIQSGPLPRGWYVALGARVLAVDPDAMIVWEKPAHWNWVMVRLADRSSHLGAGYETRQAAIDGAESLIGGLQQALPEFAPYAAEWRAGTCQDDTVSAGGHTIGLYQYDGTPGDLADQGNLWVVDFAGRGGIRIAPPA